MPKTLNIFINLSVAFLLIFGCGAKQVEGEIPSSGNEEIASILKQTISAYDLVGMGAGIIDSSGNLEIAVAGVRKAGTDQPIGIDDLWHLGSCGKAMTATVIAKLAEKGLIDWDKPLVEYFPELASDFSPELAGVRLEQLLSHRSGLPTDPLYNRDDTTNFGDQRYNVLKRSANIALEFSPGEKFHYSNLGYIIAGAVIERVTGEGFEDVCRRYLFEPLNMNAVEYEGENPPGSGKLLWSHDASGKPVDEMIYFFNDPPVLRPAGCVRASLEDWSKFIYRHLIGEESKSDYLSVESYRNLHRSRGDNYALGWGVLDRSWAGGKALNHQGSNIWNYSNVWIAPNKGFAVFVCTNQGESFKATDKVVGELIGLFRKWSDSDQDER